MDILGVENNFAFAEYRLSSNYKCGEVLCSDGVFNAPNPNSRKFVLKYKNALVTEPDHQRPIYLRTRTVTVKEVMIENQTFLFFSCSCSGLQYKKHACRHVYHLLSRFPARNDFMPECFKTYEVTYGSDTNYTQAVNPMRYWMKEAGGLLF